MAQRGGVERFIEWLKLKGEGLGFSAETGYVNPKDGYVAEVAWAFNQGEEPLFTFRVEATDGGRLLVDALAWLGTASEYVAKSWYHSLILLEGRLDESIRASIQSLAMQYRIELYEDVSDSRGEMRRLEDDLEGQARAICDLLRRYSRPVDGSTREMVRALAASVAGWPRGQPNTRISLVSDGVEGPPCGWLVIPVAGIEASPRTLRAFAPGRDEAEDFDVAPSFKPGRKVMPVNVEAPGKASCENALMRLVEAGGSTIRLSTEHRNLPFAFDLSLDLRTLWGRLDLGFDADKSVLPQALAFEELVEAAKACGEIRLVDPARGSPVAALHLR